jgi:hypothetical protein
MCEALHQRTRARVAGLCSSTSTLRAHCGLDGGMRRLCNEYSTVQYSTVQYSTVQHVTGDIKQAEGGCLLSCLVNCQ